MTSTAATPTQRHSSVYWLKNSRHWLKNSRLLLWLAFVCVHLFITILNLTLPGFPIGDITGAYQFWNMQYNVAHTLYGLSVAWVYTYLAFVPMRLSGIFGEANYSYTWFGLVMVLNALAMGAIIGRARAAHSSLVIGWWWLAFLLSLGAISLGRLDTISVPIAIVAVLMVSTRPATAAVLLTIATWIKVWPAALVLALVIVLRTRVRIALASATTNAAIILLGIVVGGGSQIFSFITEQTSRAMQIEAPVSTIWMWLAALHTPGSEIYYNKIIYTYEVTGPGAATMASAMTPILVSVMGFLVVMAARAAHAGAPALRLLGPTTLAFVTAFIAFNKVGSPQYMTWIAVPIVLGLVISHSGAGDSFRVPAIVALGVGALTQVMYPVLYGYVAGAYAPMLMAMTLRNVLIFVLLGWAIMRIIQIGRAATGGQEFAAIGVRTPPV